MIDTVASLPEGAFKVRVWTEAWRLLPRKKKFIEGNIEPRFGVEYYIYSKFAGMYYSRIIRPENDFDNLNHFITQGKIHFLLNEDQKEEIRKEVSDSGLNYYNLMLFRKYQYMLHEHEKKGDKTYGYKHTRNQLIKLINKYYD